MNMHKSLSTYACAVKSLFRPTPMQKGKSPSTGNAYNTSVKPHILVEFQRRLGEIDSTRFEEFEATWVKLEVIFDHDGAIF